MQRKEQIQDAAADHRDWVCCGFIDPVADAREESFVEGAEWADEHPKPGMVNKEEFMERACKILKNTIVDDVFANHSSVIKYMSVDEFVEYFCKAMEE